jgi:Cdc6-like AAA superfamily ATPase
MLGTGIQKKENDSEWKSYLPLNRPLRELKLALMANPPVPLLLLTGAPSTGKSMTLDHLLSNETVQGNMTKNQYAYVHCTERYTEPLLFESILNQFSGFTSSPQNNYSTYSKLENSNAFLVTLNDFLDSCASNNTQKTRYLVRWSCLVDQKSLNLNMLTLEFLKRSWIMWTD